MNIVCVAVVTEDHLIGGFSAVSKFVASSLTLCQEKLMEKIMIQLCYVFYYR